MVSNGRLSDSTLAPIYGGRLRKDAAAAWNAMNQESQRRYGVTLRPLGPASSYRTYDQQVSIYKTARPGWAANPGTSNHGWGLAVDIATHQMRSIVDEIGAKYGWAKRWSDASWEWWHLKWREGIWKPGPTRSQLEAQALRPLGKQQRKAAKTLLYRRRRRKAEAKTGKGPQWRRWNRAVKRSYKKVERLHGRAHGTRRAVLLRVLKDRNGYLTT